MATKEEWAALWPSNRPVYTEPKPTYKVLRTPRSYHVVSPGTDFTLCRRYLNKGEGEAVATFKSFRHVRKLVSCPGCQVRMDESERPD